MKFILASVALLSGEPQFTADQAQSDLALAREALERLHPGYARFTDKSELDASWLALSASMDEGTDLAGLYLGLSDILEDIRYDHTKAELPQTIEQAWETEPVYLPFRFVLFGGSMYVDQAVEATGLRRGEEILTLDGDPVADRLAAARAFMPVDGFTDHVLDTELESSGEFLGSGFDHFDALLNPDDEQSVIGVRSLDGVEREITASRIGFADFRAIKGQARRRNFSDDDAVTAEYRDENTAVLSVETFVNYRTPVTPRSVFNPIFDELAEREIETLIVDMRRNGGGSTDAMHGLLSRLTRQELTQAVTEVWITSYDFDGLRDHIDTWDPAALNPDPSLFTPREAGGFLVSERASNQLVPFERAGNAFDGEIVILTSRRNSSGVTQMVGALSDQEGVTLIGEETGGTQEGPTAGIIWFLSLPESGIVVRVPWLFQRSSVANPVIGKGFIPDIAAPETYESWMAGDDLALSAALDFAGSE